MIDNLFVFDFDDTIAKTVAEIGVARTFKQKNDNLFRDWLKNHDLYPVNEKEKDGVIYFYLPSDDFAKFQKFSSENISEDAEYLFDFGGTAGVGSGAEVHGEIMQVLKQAEGMQKSRVIIVTARDGGELNTPFGKVQSTNREDIESFLGSNGASVNQSQIFPVGSSDPQAKVTIIRRYIDALNPKTVYFYDDNELNVDAVHQLCDELRGSPNIVTFKVKDGIPGEPKEC